MLGPSLLCASLLMAFPQEPPPESSLLPSPGMMEMKVDALSYSDLLDRLHDYRWMLEAPRLGEGVHTEDRFVEPGATVRIKMTGPAIVSRLWMSSTLGTVNFYVDASETPTLTWDFAEFAANGIPSYLPSPLGMVLGTSWDSHLPLPFSQSMLVEYTAPKDRGVRLQVDRTDLGEGVVFEPISHALIEANLAHIKRVATIMQSGEKPETTMEHDPFMVGASRKVEWKEGDQIDLGEYRWTLLGSGTVRWMELTFIHKTPPAAMEEMLRGLELVVETNFEKLSQRKGDFLFRVPIGDFFGSAPGANPFYSYAVGLNAETGVFHFRLPMAFKKGMSIVVRSDFDAAARFGIRIGLDAYPSSQVRPPLTLHAGWTRAVESGTPKAAELHVDGPARLAGYVLTTTSPSLLPMSQNGAFAFADYASGPVPGGFGQVTHREGPMAFGTISMVRMYGLESPCGADGLNYSPEVSFPDGVKVDYSALAWWYAEEGSKSSMDRVYPQEQRKPAPTPDPEFFLAAGALEGESAQGLRMTEGTSVAILSVMDFSQRWSRLQLLDWSTDQAEQELVLPISITVSGKYRIHAQFATGEAYGSFIVMVDGKQLGDPIDCSGEGFAPSGEMDLGEVRLIARPDHSITIRSLDGKHVGLDYFRIVPVT
ncbi:MAG: DUF2961 domain-containing protein [Planctomycetota bacterium]